MKTLPTESKEADPTPQPTPEPAPQNQSSKAKPKAKPEVKEEEKEDAPKGPIILILGGTGFVGRNFVKYLVDNQLAGHIRVVDKRMPILSNFSPRFTEAFKASYVKYVQSDCRRPGAHLKKIWDGTKFDYVFNLCGETRCSMSDEDYRQQIVSTAAMQGAAAEKAGVKKWIELSDARAYDTGYYIGTEKSKMAADGLKQAKYRIQAENELRKFKKLPVVFLRAVNIYGVNDTTGLFPRFACAAVYKYLKEEMCFLWGAQVKMNTVHVVDVCRAMLTAATKAKVGSIYNLADKMDLDQGKCNTLLGQCFGIKTNFFGFATNTAARMAFATVVESVNNKHVPAFTELCGKYNITNTHLTPFMDGETLGQYNIWANGAKIEKELGFRYKHPKVTTELVLEVVRDYITAKKFPPILGKSVD